MSIWSNDLLGGYADHKATLVAAFKLIKPELHWKNSIDAWVRADDFDDAYEAAIFFTGSALSIVGSYFGWFHVTADGYFRTIGA